MTDICEACGQRIRQKSPHLTATQTKIFEFLRDHGPHNGRAIHAACTPNAKTVKAATVQIHYMTPALAVLGWVIESTGGPNAVYILRKIDA